MVTERFQISEAHLQRIVRKATGCSFFEYVDQRRMTLAKQLLTQTRLPVAQIMGQCGYSTTNSFYKAFKRCYGVSPTALRAQEGAKG
ncbi:MAG TPA: AraC family transcriptional regulator [Clostridia bacterium]|nr:AraC family transcriptional regulator [Clostridia bacterium]